MENIEKEALEPQKKLTREETEQLLVNDKEAQCEIISSDIDINKLPKELDESYFMNKGYTLEDIQQIEEGINNMINFLGSPVIKDLLKDHSLRRNWRRDVIGNSDEVYKYMKSNKLGIGRIISIALNLQGIERSAKRIGDSELENKIQKILSDFPDSRNYKTKNYKELTIEEKIEFVHKVDDVIIQALRVFCK